MPHEVKYLQKTQAQRRAAALKDFQFFAGDASFAKCVELARGVKSAKQVDELNGAISFVLGISGAPFHALMAKHNPPAYKLWKESRK